MNKVGTAKIIQILKFFSKFLFAFGIIGFMIYTDRLDMQVVKQGLMQPEVVLLSLGLICFGLVVTLVRWRLLLRGQNINMSFSQVFRYGMIGVFFNTTMPGMVSGDVVKAWYVIADRPKGQDKTPILTAIIIDRIIGLFGLITVSIIALALNWETVWLNENLQLIGIANMSLAVIIFIFFVAVMFSNQGPLRALRLWCDRWKEKRLGAVALKAYDSWSMYRERPLLLLAALICAAVTHSCVVLAIFFSARAIGEMGMAAYQMFLLAPIGLLCMALPVAPAGLGVGHAAFAALFSQAGSSLGAEIFTMYITIQIFVNLTGVIFYIRAPKPERAV